MSKGRLEVPTADTRAVTEEGKGLLVVEEEATGIVEKLMVADTAEMQVEKNIAVNPAAMDIAEKGAELSIAGRVVREPKATNSGLQVAAAVTLAHYDDR